VKNILLLLLLSLLVRNLQAQNDITFTRYAQEEGMPAVTIRQIFEDGKGFLWIMTEQGVHRYDGYSFKTFRHDPDDPYSLAGNKPYSFLSDSAANPVFLFTNGISVYDPDKQHFRNYTSPALMNDNGMPLDISVSKSDYARNRCWLVTGSSLIEFDPASGQVSSHSIPSSGRFTMLVFVSENSILLQEENCRSAFLYNVVEKTFREYRGDWITTAGKGNDLLLEVSAAKGMLENIPGTGRALFEGNAFYFFDKNNPDHPVRYVPKHTDKEYGYLRIHLLGDEIWISTWHGKVISINPSTGKETVYDVNTSHESNGNNKPVYSICADNEGEVWATTDGLGLIRINPSTEKITQYLEVQGNPNSVWSSSCNAILNHRSGVLWVSFLSNGLVKVEKQKKIIPTYLPLNPDAMKDLSGKRLSADVRAVLALDSTHVLVGALSNMSVIDTRTGEADFVRNRYGTEIISRLRGQGLYTAFVRDRNGNIIAGTWKKEFFIFNPANDFFREYSSATGFPVGAIGSQIRAMMIDSRNRLWIATEASVAVMNEDSFLTATPASFNYKIFPVAPRTSTGITGLPAFCLYEDRNRNVWVGTSQGLNKISPDGKVTQYVNNIENLHSISENDVRCIQEDQSGNLWVGTNGGGINKFNPATGEFIAFTMHNGLPDDAIYTFLFSDEKNIWVSSNRGLAEFNPANGTIRKFTPYDGLQNYEYNTNAACRMPGGRLVFGGTSGVNIFNPSSLNAKSTVPPIALSTFKIFNSEVALPPEGITVAHNQNNLSFEFAALSFYRSGENQYAYRMENFDPDWIYCGNIHTAVYNNLPPGNYIFHVKGTNSAGAWNDKGISYPLSILPPWWQTWWARSLAVLFIFLIVFFFIRFRTQSLRRQRAELEIRVEERTTALKSSQQQLIRQEKLASLGQLTAGIAHELKNPLNFVTNFADLSVGLVEEMKIAKTDEDRNEILSDLEINLSKINEHGRRADGIVAGMLQHARTGTGANELRLTNINSLCEESFDLAYESAKARSQHFRCIIEKQFDPAIPKINVMPQEISRVLISMFNNSFYAVREKGIALRTTENEFTPKVTLMTTLQTDSVSLAVTDNGNGIPDAVIEKIFQPFFTTKPTGQGTGLGLSISYDIVKAHGGEIKVESDPLIGTTFTVVLPRES
jgi:signal transduction histidine kinase/ligand-binding sensor domain-containing protein